MHKLIGGICFVMTLVTALLIWGPFLSWLVSLLPQTPWMGILVVMMVFLVALCGGVAIPLLCLLSGIFFWSQGDALDSSHG